MLTFLQTDGQPGLQICLDEDRWAAVPHLPGAFVVNLGDMLQRWTNDEYKSTRHRVVTAPGAKERFSVPFFFEPNFDTVS
jgi:isopenicillin N synthase-like dioxygenase